MMYATKRRRRNVKPIKSESLTTSSSSSTSSNKMTLKTNPSKRHRERLNSELDHLASLLPFEQSVVAKLDKLSVLRLAVCYLRTKSYFQAAMRLRCGQENQLLHRLHHRLHHHSQNFLYTELGLNDSDSILQALNGFLIIITCDGEVFFTSHTVEQYLGFHQSDIIHQSVFELIHSEDREQFKLHLNWRSSLTSSHAPTTCTSSSSSSSPSSSGGSTPADLKETTLEQALRAENSHILHRCFTVRFRCLLDNTSGFITLEISGNIRVVHGQSLKGKGGGERGGGGVGGGEGEGENLPLALFGLCCPFGPLPQTDLTSQDYTFKSKHKMDMSPISMDPRGKLFFGFSDRELLEKGGYDLVHTDDLAYFAAAHQELIKTGSSGLIAYRLMTKDFRWIWLQSSSKVVYKNSKPDFVLCTHRYLIEDEGRDLARKRGTEFKLPYALLDPSFRGGTALNGGGGEGVPGLGVGGRGDTGDDLGGLMMRLRGGPGGGGGVGVGGYPDELDGGGKLRSPRAIKRCKAQLRDYLQASRKRKTPYRDFHYPPHSLPTHPPHCLSSHPSYIEYMSASTPLNPPSILPVPSATAGDYFMYPYASATAAAAAAAAAAQGYCDEVRFNYHTTFSASAAIYSQQTDQQFIDRYTAYTNYYTYPTAAGVSAMISGRGNGDFQGDGYSDNYNTSRYKGAAYLHAAAAMTKFGDECENNAAVQSLCAVGGTGLDLLPPSVGGGGYRSHGQYTPEGSGFDLVAGGQLGRIYKTGDAQYGGDQGELEFIHNAVTPPVRGYNGYGGVDLASRSSGSCEPREYQGEGHGDNVRGAGVCNKMVLDSVRGESDRGQSNPLDQIMGVKHGDKILSSYLQPHIVTSSQIAPAAACEQQQQQQHQQQQEQQKQQHRQQQQLLTNGHCTVICKNTSMQPANQNVSKSSEAFDWSTPVGLSAGSNGVQYESKDGTGTSLGRCSSTANAGSCVGLATSVIQSAHHVSRQSSGRLTTLCDQNDPVNAYSTRTQSSSSPSFQTNISATSYIPPSPALAPPGVIGGGGGRGGGGGGGGGGEEGLLRSSNCCSSGSISSSNPLLNFSQVSHMLLNTSRQ